MKISLIKLKSQKNIKTKYHINKYIQSKIKKVITNQNCNKETPNQTYYLNQFKSLQQHNLKIKLEKIFQKEILEDQKLLNNKDIDLFFQEKNLGIQYNGLYWHSTKTNINIPKRHFEKWQLAFNKNLNFLAFWSDEFKHNQKLCLLIIAQCLNFSINTKNNNFLTFKSNKEKIFEYQNLIIKYIQTKTKITITDITIKKFINNPKMIFKLICKQFNKPIFCLLENRLLSFYLLFFLNYKIIKTVEPKYYIFNNNSRSLKLYNKNNSKSFKIWNYGYSLIKINQQ